MDWNIVSAIGTVLAAFVGVAGIWINFWDKHRKLNIKFEMIPNAKFGIVNICTVIKYTKFPISYF